MIIIFDLDGTLIDSEERHILVLKDILDNEKITYDKEKLKDLVKFKSSGKNTKTFLIENLNIPLEIADKVNKKWVKLIENKKYLKYDTKYGDVDYVLKMLSKDNIIYFLTARQSKKNIKKELIELDLYKYCKKLYVVSPKKSKNGKIKVVNKIITNNCKVIIVGDTEVEYSVAKKLNIHHYILNRGFRNEKYWNDKNIKNYKNLRSLKNEIDKLLTD